MEIDGRTNTVTVTRTPLAKEPGLYGVYVCGRDAEGLH